MTMLTSLRDTIRKLRRSERTLVLIRAQVRFGNENVPVDIIDISETGARLYTARHLTSQEPMLLIWGDHHQAGRIVWQDANRYGMQFEKPIQGSIIEGMLSKAQKLVG